MKFEVQRPLNAAAMLFSAILLTSCATTQVHTAAYDTTQTYAPTAPDHVQVYKMFPTKRPFVRLGEVEVNAPDYEQNTLGIWPENSNTFEAKMKEAAAKLGADGVVIVGDGYSYYDPTTGMKSNQYTDPVTGQTYSSLDLKLPEYKGRKALAIALKFTDK